MLKQVRYLKWEEEREKIQRKVLAPIEHLFQNHEYCDEQWCYVLQAQKEKTLMFLKNQDHCSSKVKNLGCTNN